MLKRPRIIAISVVLLLVVVVLNLPERWTSQLKFVIGGFFIPLFGLAGSSQSLVSKAGDTLAPRSALVQEIETLRLENQSLQIRLTQAAEIQRENDRLRSQLGIARQYAWKLKYAQVIGRDPANWWRAVHIDLGARDGMQPDLVVLTPQGLVGRIADVGATRSRVILVGDPNCGVAAMISETRDATGVIAPSSSGGFDNTLVDLTKLSHNSNLKPGQSVMTSGKGGVFPPGIPIGQIVDSRVMEFGLYAEARVKLAVDYNKLEDVWVKMP
jgi:rod shape-determining protein MreC